jgi:hypothetical protein
MRYYSMTMMSDSAANAYLTQHHVSGANVCANDLPATMNSDAASLQGGAGTTGMDGAPLYAYSTWGGPNYVIGLDSWTLTSSDLSKPHVFVDVGAYAGWIAAHMW